MVGQFFNLFTIYTHQRDQIIWHVYVILIAKACILQRTGRFWGNLNDVKMCENTGELLNVKTPQAVSIVKGIWNLQSWRTQATNVARDLRSSVCMSLARDTVMGTGQRDVAFYLFENARQNNVVRPVDITSKRRNKFALALRKSKTIVLSRARRLKTVVGLQQ